MVGIQSGPDVFLQFKLGTNFDTSSADVEKRNMPFFKSVPKYGSIKTGSQQKNCGLKDFKNILTLPSAICEETALFAKNFL